MKVSKGFLLTKPMAVNTGLRNCAACDLSLAVLIVEIEDIPDSIKDCKKLQVVNFSSNPLQT